jgi:ABC-type glycerol-3-phosphate transport system permease component
MINNSLFRNLFSKKFTFQKYKLLWQQTSKDLIIFAVRSCYFSFFKTACRILFEGIYAYDSNYYLKLASREEARDMRNPTGARKTSLQFP